MKIRITITDRSWEYRLSIRRAAPGQWFTKLLAADGSELEHAPCLGYVPTADAAIEAAPASYLQLVAMLHSNHAAASFRSPAETTLNHSAEHTARG